MANSYEGTLVTLTDRLHAPTAPPADPRPTENVATNARRAAALLRARTKALEDAPVNDPASPLWDRFFELDVAAL